MKEKKKKLSAITEFMLIAVVIGAVAAFFILGKGVGFGAGSNKGNIEGSQGTVKPSSSQSDTADSPSESQTQESGTEKIECLMITVSGNEYLYQNKKVTIDELISILDDSSADVPVNITDDNSSLKAYRKLKNMLDEHKIKYIETSSD